MHERKTFANIANRNIKKLDSFVGEKAELRKSNKPLLEKKRRARINRSLEQLKNLLIESVKADTTSGYSKLEKADILEMTVKHLKQLQQERIKKSSGDLDPSLRYKAGFNECLYEVDRFLSCMENSAGGSEIRMHLVNHLTEITRSISSSSSTADDDRHRVNSRPVPASTPGMGNPRSWVDPRNLSGDFPNVHVPSHPFYFQGTTTTTTTTTGNDQRWSNEQDVENVPSDGRRRGDRFIRSRKRRRFVDDQNSMHHHPHNHPHHHPHQQASNLNCSYTISSTTSPFSSPLQQELKQQEQQQEQQDVTLCRTTMDDFNRRASLLLPPSFHPSVTKVSGHQPSKTGCSASPPSSIGSNSSGGGGGTSPGVTHHRREATEEEVKLESVWRPW